MKELFKRCRVCHIYFPASLNSINCYCALHQDVYKSMLKSWLKKRFIPMKALDVYEKEGDKYFQVCRLCGKSLLTKKMVHCKSIRYCNSVDCKTDKEFLHNLSWAFASHNYIFNLLKSQEKERKEAIQKEYEASVHNPTWQYYEYNRGYGKDHVLHLMDQKGVFCEECHKLCILEEWNHLKDHCLQIHHKVAVYFLNEENWELLFHPMNLIALCKTCHEKKHDAVFEARSEVLEQDHLLHRMLKKEKEERAYHKMDEFF